MKKALVIKFLVSHYLISDLANNNKIIAQIRGKLKQKEDYIKQQKFIIKIGDIVVYEKSDDKYFITQVLQRKNELSRPNIANVDQVILIFSLFKPLFQFRLLDKFLLILGKYNLKIILLFTKIDLISDDKLLHIQQKISYYQKFYKIFYISNKNQCFSFYFKDIFKNKITVLAGQTGVGKSTFLNTLHPHLKLKTQELSSKKGLGKHTTKNAQLYEFNDGYIADTPGFSKLNLNILDYKELKLFFPDFIIYAKNCYFKHDCNHVQENKCSVKKAVELNFIKEWRYNNYLRFFNFVKNKQKL